MDAFDAEAEERRIIREGVERSNALFKLYQPRPGPLTPMACRQENEPVVWVMVPKAFSITRDPPTFDRVNVPAGIHQIPLSIATHFYAKCNKVEVHESAELAAVALQGVRDLEEKKRLKAQAEERKLLRVLNGYQNVR
jgi:hypothetical protein